MQEITSTNISRHPLLIAVIVGGLFYLAGQYLASQPQRLQQEVEAGREITVQGTGEITAQPDIAKLTLGVNTGAQSTAAAAEQQLESKINAVIASIKAQGIAEEDIKTTNLSLNPIYDFIEGRRVDRGFEANQMVEVKIRELDTVGAVLSAATGEGVNQAGNIQFEIDDPAQFRQQAQEKAIAQARANAEDLAEALGVRLGDVKNFSSQIDSPTDPPIFARAELATDQALGGVETPAGTQDVTATVEITYQIR